MSSSSVPSCITTPLVDSNDSLTPPALTSVSPKLDLQTDTGSSPWLPVISCPAEFPKELFKVAVLQMVHHPEHNSTLILRSETVADYNFLDEHEHEHEGNASGTPIVMGSVPTLKGFIATQCIHRKLLPRRPGRDAGLEQLCTLYADQHDEERVPVVLILTPLLQEGSTSLPFYHPPVRHIAFRFANPAFSSGPDLDITSPSPSLSPATLRIEAQLLPLSPPTQTSPTSRFYRTFLALLKTLHRYAWGALTHYQKRVLHDCLIPRETYQDLYLVMRERYKGMVKEWKEVTDPLKHVFEDIAIATYLMLLWKDTFKSEEGIQTELEVGSVDYTSEPWRNWGRPPTGFLDFGCGNGLLTHILVNEGYDGFGVDLRSRTSWSSYPETTQSRLHVYTFDPTTLTSPIPPPPNATTHASSSSSSPSYFKPGTFLIGNHADELTPWLPIVSRYTDSSGYLSIPCCTWALDSKFERSLTPKSFPYVPDLTPSPLKRANYAGDDAVVVVVNVGTGIGDAGDTDEAGDVERSEDRLKLGGVGWGDEANGKEKKNWQSAYTVYRIWLAGLSEYCGWEVECDTLRIPSTRNWAIVGRRTSKEVDVEDVKRNVKEILEYVNERGLWKARKPEGSGEH